MEAILEHGELSSRFDFRNVDYVMESWRRGDRDTVKLIKKELAKVGLTRADVTARALVSHLREAEKLNYLIFQLEARRSAIMRELDRHRDAVSRHDLREKLAGVEDAKFADVPADEAEQAA